jgi:hypothetical protein
MTRQIDPVLYRAEWSICIFLLSCHCALPAALIFLLSVRPSIAIATNSAGTAASPDLGQVAR